MRARRTSSTTPRPRRATASGRCRRCSIPSTTRHLDRLGITAGWRCWEVGAGGPSVPTWMAGRVGLSGEVLATDIDISWIANAAAFDVLRHDVAADDGPRARFDLVHARLVLTHVPIGPRPCVDGSPRCDPAGGWSSRTSTSSLQPAACLDAATMT